MTCWRSCCRTTGGAARRPSHQTLTTEIPDERDSTMTADPGPPPGQSPSGQSPPPASPRPSPPSSAPPSSAPPSSAPPSSAPPSSALPSSALPSSALPSSAVPSSALPSSAPPRPDPPQLIRPDPSRRQGAVLDESHLGDIEGALGRIRVGDDDSRRGLRRRLVTFLAI